MQQGLAGNEGDEACHGAFGKDSVTVPDYDRAPRQQRAVEHEYKYSAHQTILLYDEAVHIVLVHHRHDISLGTLSGTFSQKAARAYGNLGADYLFRAVKNLLECQCPRFELVQFLNRIAVKIADTGNRSRHPGKEFPSRELLQSENHAEGNDSGNQKMGNVFPLHVPDNDREAHHKSQEYGTGVTSGKFQKEDNDHRSPEVEHYPALLA